MAVEEGGMFIPLPAGLLDLALASAHRSDASVSEIRYIFEAALRANREDATMWKKFYLWERDTAGNLKEARLIAARAARVVPHFDVALM